MLYAAALEDNAEKKEDIYKKTAELYPNDSRAFNNIAALEFAKGNNDAAQNYLSKALAVDGNTAEANANKGLIALLNGNAAEAQTLIAKANGANDLNKAVGALNIANGKYAQAEEAMKGVNSNTAALAQILNKNYAGAQTTLNNIKNKNGLTDYLYAIINARQGNSSAASSYLKSAVQKDPSLASYAANDLEFLNVNK